MYRGNRDKSSMNYFKEFLEINQEELFYIICPYIEDKIIEWFEKNIKFIADLSGVREDL